MTATIDTTEIDTDPFAFIPTDTLADVLPTRRERAAKAEQAAAQPAPTADVTTGYGPAQVEAAQDAIDDGAVVKIGHLFLVVSADGTERYETAVTGECSCRAAVYGRRCWHTLAARLADSAGWPETDEDEIPFPPLPGDNEGVAYSTDPIDY